MLFQEPGNLCSKAGNVLIKPLENSWKCRFWFSRSVVRPLDSAFLTSSRFVPIRLVHRSHFEEQGREYYSWLRLLVFYLAVAVYWRQVLFHLKKKFLLWHTKKYLLYAHMPFNTCQFPHFQEEDILEYHELKLLLSGFKIEEMVMLWGKRFLKTTIYRKLFIGQVSPIKWGMRNSNGEWSLSGKTFTCIFLLVW